MLIKLSDIHLDFSLENIFALSNYHWNWLVLPFLIAGLLTMFIGVYVTLYGGLLKKKVAFLFIIVSISLWLFGTFLGYSATTLSAAFFFGRIAYAGVCFMPVSLFYYAIIWTEYKESKISSVAVFLGLILATAFTLIIAFTAWVVCGATQYYWGYHTRLSILGGFLFLSYFLSYMSLFFWILYKGYQKELDRFKRKQITLISLAFFITNLGTSDFLPCYGLEIFPVGGLMMFASCVALAYTIVRYKLFDIETMIHRTILWFVSTSVAIVPFVLVLYFCEEFLENRSNFFSTVFLLTILILFAYYFQFVQPKIGELLRMKSANLNRTMIAFSRRLTHLNDLRILLQRLTRTIQRSIHVNRVAVFLIDEEKGLLVPAMAKRIRGLAPISISEPFLKWMETKNKVVVTRLVVSDPDIASFKKTFVSYLNGVGVELMMPLVHSGKLIGLIVLGKKENLKGYRSLEVNFLSDLRVPVSIALSNSMRLDDVSKLYKELQTLNEELEQRVDDRTRELVETQGQLIQAEKLATIGTMAGGVAHEINNPLTAVLTNAQILKMTAVDDDVEMIEMIEEGAKRCQEITKKLLNYARKETKSEVLVEVNLVDIVLGISNFLQYQLEQEGLKLNIKTFSNLIVIKGVKTELEQVLTNLILNSRDAILAAKDQREGVISVHLIRKEDEVILSVSDNGIGIADENINKIFDPFFTTKDVGSGTGLGLSVSLGIIQKHNASIKVESIIGVGTTLKVIFKEGKI